MYELGWVEGKNVEYRTDYADGDLDRLDVLVRELVRQAVDVIVVGTSPTTRLVQRATTTIPIVMMAVANPVENGFVASLSKPGGNITGLATQQDEVLVKLIEILHTVTPVARRIAFLMNDSNPSHAIAWPAAQSACAALGLVALRVAASAPAQLGAVGEQIVRQRAEAVVVVADGMFLGQRAQLQDLMQATRLPLAYGYREHVVAGGLLSYAVNLAESFRYAAKYVDKILKGAKPFDLPVEQPTKFELVFNMKTAAALGLTIPQALLLRADEVIR